MKMTIENLGLLGKADIEIKDLTIICGENNTGKTYATYAVYGFLRNWRQILRSIISLELNKKITTSGNIIVNLEDLYFGKINSYLLKASKRYEDILPQVFAARKDAFEGCSVLIKVDSEHDFIETSYLNSVESGTGGKVLATISKESGARELNVLLSDGELVHVRALVDFVADAIIEIVFKPYFPRVHISSAERTGAAIFRGELDIARTRMLKALMEMDSKDLRRPFAWLQKMDTDYAWPVEDNVEFVRGLENIDKQVGELATSNPELIEAFDALIGGTYKVVKDAGLVFQPKGSVKRRFTMSEASSCVRALLDVGFYLRCKAKSGDLFIIDEPELNLHPKNQRTFARMVAMMVNAGVKIFITTHSDYLIKEFNTLIMLNQKNNHTKSIQKKYSYLDNELIHFDKICLYMTGTSLMPAEQKGKRATRINVLRKANIYPDRGIEVTTFDDTIDLMNEIQSDILYGGPL